MKLSAITAFAVLQSFSVGVVRADPVIDTVERVYWPDKVDISGGHLGGRKDHEMTNQERLKRGLKPAKPKRLYNGQAKRLAPHPSSGVNPDRTFDFYGCTTTIKPTGATQTEYLTATSNDDAVTQCAIKTGTAASDFAVKIYDTSPYTHSCTYSFEMPYNNELEDCTTTDYAVYLQSS